MGAKYSKNVECSRCGVTFLKVVSKKKYLSTKTHFCSKSCRYPNNKVLTCAECEKEFTRSVPNRPKVGNVFCSRSCSSSFNNRVYPKRSLEGVCDCCGSACKATTKYCRSCYEDKFFTDWSKVTYAEVVGKRKYQKHSRIRTLARRWYENSSNPKHCMMCGYDKAYQVAHIVEIGDHSPEDSIAFINRPENLLSLCIRCHWELDKLDLTLDRIESSPYYFKVE